jgi:7-cyano-7-deazaguanine synthase
MSSRFADRAAVFPALARVPAWMRRMPASPRAIVLLSGGMDSATTLHLARRDGFELYALTVRYGQRHAHELEAARRVAGRAHVRQHRIVPIDLAAFGGSALTGPQPVPRHRSAAELAAGIPSTYVPARNTIFLALALAWAEVLAAWDLYIGVTAVDYSGYPDCRPEFIAAFEHLAQLATRAGVEQRGVFRIHAPLLHLSKAQIIRAGLAAGVDFALTHSCYDPDAHGRACGACDACRLRRRGFGECGLVDPIEYQEPAR